MPPIYFPIGVYCLKRNLVLVYGPRNQRFDVQYCRIWSFKSCMCHLGNLDHRHVSDTLQLQLIMTKKISAFHIKVKMRTGGQNLGQSQASQYSQDAYGWTKAGPVTSQSLQSNVHVLQTPSPFSSPHAYALAASRPGSMPLLGSMALHSCR